MAASSPKLALRGLRRDWLSGELGVLSAALLVAVAAMTAIGFFTDRVAQAINEEAAGVLAADIVVSSRAPMAPDWLIEAERRGIASAEVISFPSVVISGENSALAEIRAVSDAYPLRGDLEVRDELLTPARIARGVPPPGTAWADPRLLARLDASGDVELAVGALNMTTDTLLEHVPDRGWRFVDLAPTLLINLADVPATELVQPGSRVSYNFLFAGDRTAMSNFRGWIEPRLVDGQRLRTLDDAQPEIRRALDRARRFLGLAAMVSVLLAAVAIALSARHYAARHMDLAALMKCLGARQAQIMRINLVQLGALALFAGVAGSLLGYASQAFLTVLLQGLLAGDLPAAGLRPAVAGLGTAALLLAGFALPSLMQLRRVPPARVLRHDLTPPPLSSFVVYGAALAALSMMLWWLVGDLSLMLWIGLGTVATGLVLVLAGWLLVVATGRMRGQVGVAWRYGLANISRRGRDSVIQVTAFGLGLMVLLLLGVVRGDLLDGWRATLPDDAPNHFLINIQPDETQPLRNFFAEQGIGVPTLVPLVRARLRAINGDAVDGRYASNSRAERFVEREANLSYSATLPAANAVTQGQFWEGPTPAPEVSVETEFADTLGIALGDELSFHIAGETLTARVTSLRSVEWDSFQPNFFMVFSPGSLDDFPATFISSVYLEEAQRPVLLQLIRAFPSVTAIDMEAILNQVRGVIDKAVLAVQYVFGFTLLAGIVVLIAAIQTTREERRYESAMLRTLGARRRVVLAGLATEFAVLGLLAGVLAASGATLCAALLAQDFDLPLSINPMLWVYGLLTGVLLVGATGTLATRSAVREAPVTILRRF